MRDSIAPINQAKSRFDDGVNLSLNLRRRRPMRAKGLQHAKLGLDAHAHEGDASLLLVRDSQYGSDGDHGVVLKKASPANDFSSSAVVSLRGVEANLENASHGYLLTPRGRSLETKPGSGLLSRDRHAKVTLAALLKRYVPLQPRQNNNVAIVSRPVAGQA